MVKSSFKGVWFFRATRLNAGEETNLTQSLRVQLVGVSLEGLVFLETQTDCLKQRKSRMIFDGSTANHPTVPRCGGSIPSALLKI